MSKKTSQPAPPNPAATAAAQGAANKEAVRESALVNQIGTEGPAGTTYYTGEIGSPDRKQVTELTPTGQQAFESQQNIGATLGGRGEQLATEISGQPTSIDYSGLPTAPWEQDLSAQAQGLEDATYQRGYNLLQPEHLRQSDALNTQLANQGITQGSEAYDTEQGRLSDAQNRALTDLSLASVGAGRAEQSRLFGLGSSGRGQALGELYQQRQTPMNELAALLQGSPAVSSPQAVAPGQYGVQPGDIQGATQAAYQGALSNANRQAGANQAMYSNLFGLGGALGGGYLAGR